MERCYLFLKHGRHGIDTVQKTLQKKNMQKLAYSRRAILVESIANLGFHVRRFATSTQKNWYYYFPCSYEN